MPLPRASPEMSSSTPSDQSNVFSVRIVSLDYYMAPPIPDLDFCYNAFQDRKVEEVPVVRIYGSTPAGQKACLHVHRALPYLYIPYSDDLHPHPEEGHTYLHVLSRAIEKALSYKSTVSKRQHVHGCSLVQAKKFYGYHPSEELFIKIYLYYPHEVARAAALLLGGDILNQTFQPYESHIPYLLQFLVDYNLYGMSHIHTSKFKFRLPLPDVVIPKEACYPKRDMLADSSSSQVGNPAIWLSSTVPSGFVWASSATGHENLEDKSIPLIRRQSICALELDSSVDDILNENYKLYTSLSQNKSEVKMVQSLVPIWEEYERSGVHEAVKSPDFSKPLPENVLRIFLNGLEYENAFSELCLEEQKSFPSEVSPNDAEKLEKCIKAFTDSDKAFMDHWRLSSPCDGGEDLKRPEEEYKTGRLSPGFPTEEKEYTTPNEKMSKFHGLVFVGKKTPSCKMVGTEDSKSPDNEALGLLSWLASSQAAEDLITDDELVHEAILSPLLATKSYKKALEIAHLDFESASQQECQDILDSVDVLKSDGLKEHASSAGSHENMVSASSAYVIPQVDGSSDENFKTPQNDGFSEINLNIGRENSSVHHAGKSTSKRIGGKRKKKRILWGPLVFSNIPMKHDDSESTSLNSCDIEMNNDSESSSSSGCKDGSCDVSRLHTGMETSGEKMGKLSACSVRDLMRKKRCFRAEQPGCEREVVNISSEVQENEILTDYPKEPIHHSFETERPNIVFGNPQHKNSSLIDHDGKYMSNLDVDVAQERQTKNRIRGELDVGTRSSESECKTFTDLNKEKSPVEYIEMAFSRKPPSRNEVGRISEHSLRTDGDDESLSFHYSLLHTNRQCMNEFLPFFVTKSEEGQSSKSSLNEQNLNFHPGSTHGIPCHFQNDGSILYLLTHAFLPPTVDSVHQWLSEVFQHNCSNDTTAIARTEASLESNAALGLKLAISPPSQENSKIVVAESYSSQVDIVSNEPRVAGIAKKENVAANNWQDISQISGPDEKSNLTPLSQIGFRDPASIGRGQQLTLISIEVQADSRGDLRPDPQFDAINIISLAIQEDMGPTFEVYVLMRGDNEEPFWRNVNGVFGCKFVIVHEEKHLLDHFVKVISSFDPDILMGWEIQGGSLGFLAERAAHLGVGLLKNISRAPPCETKYKVKDSGNSKSSEVLSEPSMADTVLEDAIIEDEWGRTHASGLNVVGRIVLNVWRLMRAEVKLNMYSVEAVAEEVLKQKIPYIPCRILNQWFLSGPGRARYRCIEYVIERAKLNIQIMNQLDMINRTSELARVFGIDFFSVLSRGSQFRVESMLLRLAHTQNYLAISPGNQQVASQPAMECLPLVMEPESGFYVDPVIVLDFQSLYPSMIIAYNLCFSTCLGKVVPSKASVLGVSSYSPKAQLLKDLKQHILLTPNGVMYVSSKVRKGVLPRLLDEILSTRIMIKQAMKKLIPSQQVLQRIFNARQLALKLIANVTYGYTAAGFSGRMPCAELADSIVQCGRRTLETAISFVNEHDKWKARVIYGDTDSMFVLLKGRSLEEAFRIGNEIASSITAMNPIPVTLKMEKVYHPCFLLTKKRYVGYSYESPEQNQPTFDAKGIETVRRDTCPAVAKTLEQSLRLIFKHQDIDKVKSYLHRQWTRIISGKVSLQDFIFAKEVRLGTYRAGATSLPPAAIVATKAMRLDPRAEPRYGERIPYVVIHGEPGGRLIDMVVDPSDLLEIDSPYRLNDLYYINKQIIPALQRVFGLVGADLNQWFSEMPRPARLTLAKRHSSVSHSGSLNECDDKRLGLSKKAQAKRSRIDTYYISKHCTLCGELVEASSASLCDKCSKKESLVATVVVGRTSKLEREIRHLADICRHCGGGDWIVESGVKCTSLACSVFYERRKVQKEFKSLSAFATEAGYYPSCSAEWF